MPDGPPSDQPPPREERPARPDWPRRRGLTPEQRRFLGAPRIREKRAETPGVHEDTRADATVPYLPEEAPADPPRTFDPSRRTEKAETATPSPIHEGEQETRETREPEDPDSGPSKKLLRPDEERSRIPEMQRALLILGALLLLGLTFYVGMRFPYWRHKLYSARNAPKLDQVRDKFPGISAEELVQQALKLERAGNKRDAAERYIAAKHKNLRYRGILQRVGRIAYDNGEFHTADKLFERAIAFGENIDTANYYRGLIAVRRKDLPAAQRFFEAAATASPFIADHHFYLAETLRMDHRPYDAIPRYAQAALLARTEEAATVCRFKMRMTRLEAAEMSKIGAEIEAERKSGTLPVDWLMTAAALHIREARVDEGVALIAQARAANQPGLFVSCVADRFFVDAGQKNPAIAEACRVEAAPPPGG